MNTAVTNTTQMTQLLLISGYFNKAYVVTRSEICKAPNGIYLQLLFPDTRSHIENFVCAYSVYSVYTVQEATKEWKPIKVVVGHGALRGCLIARKKVSDEESWLLWCVVFQADVRRTV